MRGKRFGWLVGSTLMVTSLMLPMQLTYAEENQASQEAEENQDKLEDFGLGYERSPESETDILENIGDNRRRTYSDEFFEASYKSPYISSIKSQERANLCWAFAANGMLECAVMKKEGITDPDAVDFSEAHLGYAMSKMCDGYGYGTRESTDGAKFEVAEAYWSRNAYCGPVNEEDAPFVLINWGVLPQKRCSRRKGQITM